MNKNFILVICILLSSCSEKNKVPVEIIQPIEMQKILWDIARADVLSNEISRKDSTVNKVAETNVLTQKVFEIHNTTSSAFNKSYLWYTNHPDIMKTILDSMNVQNQRESQLLMKDKFKPVNKPINKPVKFNSLPK